MTQCDEAIRRQLRKPVVYIMCGVPGSGKTHWAIRFRNMSIKKNNYPMVYISSDNIREELCGNAQDQSFNKEVFELFYKRAREAVILYNDVILDATHLTKKSRRKCRNHFKDLNCKFIAVQLATPIGTAIRRNKNRSRVVPNYAMNRMINAFQPVEDDEGFEDIWVVN